MYYENMPLYPRLGQGCDREACVRVPVFSDERRGCGQMPDPCRCRRVTIENPCRPGEQVEVLLGVDDCGNLVVCVRRDPRDPCDCRPHRPPRPCPPPRGCGEPCPPPPLCRPSCRGRLYGSWK